MQEEEKELEQQEEHQQSVLLANKLLEALYNNA